jgi:RNA polymerase sigma factor (sigma-70 family)
VYGTARNVINNYLRTRSRLKEDPLDATLELASTDPDDTSERVALVRRALRALDPMSRNILWLTLAEGLKPGEIARRLGLTSEVVRTRKSRALKKTIERVKKLSRT